MPLNPRCHVCDKNIKIRGVYCQICGKAIHPTCSRIWKEFKTAKVLPLKLCFSCLSSKTQGFVQFKYKWIPITEADISQFTKYPDIHKRYKDGSKNKKKKD